MNTFRNHALVFAFFAACGVKLAPPASAQIACTGRASCPSGWTCDTTRGLCAIANGVDTTPPTLTALLALSANTVSFTFDEAVNATTLQLTTIPDLGPFTMSAGADPQSIVVQTAHQQPSFVYALTASGTKDLAGNVMLPISESFVGFGPPPDVNPPALVSPADGEVVANVGTIPVTLVWTSVAGAASYDVDVSANADFSQPIVSLQGLAATTTSVTLTNAVIYYWRVRADVTAAGAYSVRTLQAIDDRVRVYCASGASCAAGGIGNLSAPFTRIGEAIITAQSLGLSRVDVAARGGTDAYVESVALRAGVSLYGGYSADFSTRDVVANTTIIQNDDLANVTADQITGVVTALDGFTVTHGTFAGVLHAGVSITASDSSVEIRNCRIMPNFGNDAYGIFVGGGVSDGGGGPLLQDNTIIGSPVTLAGRSGRSYGIELAASSARIVHNQLTNALGVSGANNYSVHVFGAAGTAIIDRNTIDTRGAISSPNVRGVEFEGGCAQVTNNVIITDRKNVGAHAMNFLSNGCGANNALIINNTIVTRDGPGAGTQALINSATSHVIYANNIFIAETSPTNALSGTTPLWLGSNVFASITPNVTTTGNDASLAAATWASNPLGFVDPANDDYHLTESSPDSARFDGVDASQASCDGATCGDVTSDLDGVTRTCTGSNACYSAGAFESD